MGDRQVLCRGCGRQKTRDDYQYCGICSYRRAKRSTTPPPNGDQSSDANPSPEPEKVAILVEVEISPYDVVDLYERIGEICTYYCGDNAHMTTIAPTDAPLPNGDQS